MSTSLLFEIGTSLVIQVGLLVGLALIFDRLCDSARCSGQIWTATFVAILTLTCCAFLLPHARWFSLPVSGQSSTLGNVFRVQIEVVKWFGVVWFAGFVVALLRRLYRYLALLHFLRVRCRPFSAKDLRSLPEDAVAKAPTGTRWLLSDQRHSPFCWQMHRPTIVLPTSLLDVNVQVQRHILSHEYEHIKTGHPLQLFLQGLCSTLFWFHPAVRLAAQRAELTREFWCDEVAARDRDGIASYLRSLAVVSEQSIDVPSCALGIGRGHSAIVRRSRRLADRTRHQAWLPGVDGHGWLQRRVASGIVLIAILISQFWLPVNLLASHRDLWSPWPSWTANTLHDFGVSVRDFETFDHSREAQDWLHLDD